MKKKLDTMIERETDMTNLLVEQYYYLTADYRAKNPEADAAFFIEYPEAQWLKDRDIERERVRLEQMDLYEQLTFDNLLRERVNKEYE